MQWRRFMLILHFYNFTKEYQVTGKFSKSIMKRLVSIMPWNLSRDVNPTRFPIFELWSSDVKGCHARVFVKFFQLMHDLHEMFFGLQLLAWMCIFLNFWI